MADESPGKPLREDVQAKQQALDEAKAALAKYEADKAAAATADADEDEQGHLPPRQRPRVRELRGDLRGAAVAAQLSESTRE